MPNYMQNLLEDFRVRYNLSDEAIEHIRLELVRSFKNGLKQGREGKRPDGGTRANPRKPLTS